jgi:hypothetical protein
MILGSRQKERHPDQWLLGIERLEMNRQNPYSYAMAKIPRYDEVHSKPEQPLDQDIQATFDQAFSLLIRAADLSRERGQSRAFNWEFNTRIRDSGQIDARTISFGDSENPIWSKRGKSGSE